MISNTLLDGHTAHAAIVALLLARHHVLAAGSALALAAARVLRLPLVAAPHEYPPGIRAVDRMVQVDRMRAAAGRDVALGDLHLAGAELLVRVPVGIDQGVREHPLDRAPSAEPLVERYHPLVGIPEGGAQRVGDGHEPVVDRHVEPEPELEPRDEVGRRGRVEDLLREHPHPVAEHVDVRGPAGHLLRVQRGAHDQRAAVHRHRGAEAVARRGPGQLLHELPGARPAPAPVLAAAAAMVIVMLVRPLEPEHRHGAGGGGRVRDVPDERPVVLERDVRDRGRGAHPGQGQRRDHPPRYSSRRTRSIGLRFRQSLNENAKTHGFAGVVPELCHNDIVGWDRGAASGKKRASREETSGSYLCTNLAKTGKTILSK